MEKNFESCPIYFDKTIFSSFRSILNHKYLNHPQMMTLICQQITCFYSTEDPLDHFAATESIFSNQKNQFHTSSQLLVLSKFNELILKVPNYQFELLR